MTIQGTRYSAAGADVTDEVVRCTESVTRSGGTYYRGWLRQVPEPSVIGNTDADYGVWTAASKGGTRLEVVESTLPSGASQVGLDRATGEVLSTTSRSVYARYVGHGDFMVAGVMTIPVPIPGMTADGTAADLAKVRAPVNLEVVGYSIEIPITGGGVPQGDVTLSLRDYVDGDSGNAAADTLDIGNGDDETVPTPLSAAFRVDGGDLLVLYGDGQGMQGAMVYLYARAV